jgi:hypothetical protein
MQLHKAAVTPLLSSSLVEAMPGEVGPGIFGAAKVRFLVLIAAYLSFCLAKKHRLLLSCCFD